MLRWLKDTPVGRAVVAFSAGGIGFAAIWLAGFPEYASVPFGAASVVWGATTFGRRCEPGRGARTEPR